MEISIIVVDSLPLVIHVNTYFSASCEFYILLSFIGMCYIPIWVFGMVATSHTPVLGKITAFSAISVSFTFLLSLHAYMEIVLARDALHCCKSSMHTPELEISSTQDQWTANK